MYLSDEPADYITIQIRKHPRLEATPIDEFDLQQWLNSLVQGEAVLLTNQGDRWVCDWQSTITAP